MRACSTSAFPVRTACGSPARSLIVAAVVLLLVGEPAAAQSASRVETAGQAQGNGVTTPDKPEAQDPPDKQHKSKDDKGKKNKKDKDKKEPEPEGIHFALRDHPTLVFSKKTYVDFRARFRADATDSELGIREDEVTQTDDPKRRIGVGGDVEHLVEFQIERELSGDDPWRDVFANYHQFDFAQLQGGKFKLPFSLDENTSPANLDFVFRSLAANHLAPGRDIGVMVHGRVLKRIVRYELGKFDHDGRNGRTRNLERVYGDQTIAGRVTVQPFRGTKSVGEDLQVGVAFTSSDVPLGYTSLRGQTFLNATFFKPDFLVQGQRRRVGFELRWRPGPFSVKSEYMRVTTERLGQSVEDTDLSPLLATGWYVSGTWAITGERKADGLMSPRRPLLQGGYGAIEVAGRIERLAFGSEASGEPPSTSIRADVIQGNADRAVTLGVNWYVNRWIKLQFNTIKETLSDPELGPLPSKASFWTRVFRLQLSL
ncbi:MAG TPA: porin [Vicinamibacterales bacterium]|jgi:phosphate-selective porin OprO and OprP|nr:porin [Vicinamibacterales bacterium]